MHRECYIHTGDAFTTCSGTDRQHRVLRFLSPRHRIAVVSATPQDPAKLLTLPPRECSRVSYSSFIRADWRCAPRTRLDNLISRFEEPQSAARWDAPLFTVADDDPPFDATATSQQGETKLDSKDAERIWTAITEGVIKPSTVATQQVRRTRGLGRDCRHTEMSGPTDPSLCG